MGAKMGRLEALLVRFQCALPKSYSRTAAVLVDELDAGIFKGPPNDIEGGAPRAARACFQLMDSDDSYTRLSREILLAPVKKPSSRPRLRRCDHRIAASPKYMIPTIP